MITATPETLRRAAVLVASLDRDTVDLLLGQLSPAQARRVRQAVVELGDIEDDEQEDTLTFFTRVRIPVPDRHAGGIELDDRLASRLATVQRDEVQFTTAPTDTERDNDEPPFRFLHEARMDELATRLGREHPQTIAIVLAHLPAEQAAEALCGLATSTQVEVVRRLAQLESADGAVVREIESALRTWIEPGMATGSAVVGVAAAQRILDAAAASSRRHLLTSLVDRDPALAQRLTPGRVIARLTPMPSTAVGIAPAPEMPELNPTARPAALCFADLQSLDTATLTRLWRAVDPQVAVLALAGASHEFVDTVLGALSHGEAVELCRQLDDLGPVSLADLDAAQREVSELASRLGATRKADSSYGSAAGRNGS